MGEIRFVGTAETRGYPYLVCKKKFVKSAHLKYGIYKPSFFSDVQPPEVASALVSLSDVQPLSVYKSHILNGPINKLCVIKIV